MSQGSSSPRTPQKQSKERTESSSSDYLSSDGGSEWPSRASLAWEEKSGSKMMRSSSITSGDSDYWSQASTLDNESLSLLDREFIKLLSMEESSDASKVEDGTGARDGRIDLLDSLIMEDLHASLKHSKDEDVPCLSNLMKLLEMKSPSPVHGKRPITKTTSKLTSSGIALQLTALMDQDVALRFPGQFGQVEYKVPPSSHPPALPLVFPSHYQTGTPHPSPAQAALLLGSGQGSDVKSSMENAFYQILALEREKERLERTLTTKYPALKFAYQAYTRTQSKRTEGKMSQLKRLVDDANRILCWTSEVLQLAVKASGEKKKKNGSCLVNWRQAVVEVSLLARKEQSNLGKGCSVEVEEAVSAMTLEIRKARTLLWSTVGIFAMN